MSLIEKSSNSTCLSKEQNFESFTALMLRQINTNDYSLYTTQKNYLFQKKDPIKKLTQLATRLFFSDKEVEGLSNNDKLIELIDRRITLLQKYASIFNFYCENQSGALFVKSSKEITWIKTSVLMAILEAAFQCQIGKQHPYVTSGNLELGGCEFAMNEINCAFKLHRNNDALNIFLFSPFKPLGEGVSSTVRKVLRISSGQFEAMKIARTGIQGYILSEAETLIYLNDRIFNYPNIQSRPTSVFNFKSKLGESVCAITGELYADKLDLYQMAKSKLTLEQRLLLSATLVNILWTAHSTAQIVHRDIKPDNILFKKEKEKEGYNYLMVLADWGIALHPKSPTFQLLLPGKRNASLKDVQQVYLMQNKLAKAVNENNFTAIKTIFLEALKGYAAQDIFALGSTVYFILTNEAPYTIAQENDFPVENAVFRAEPLIKKGYSQYVIDLIKSMVDLDPNKRPKIHELETKWNIFFTRQK